MTARERQASGGATLAERPAPARTSAPGAERDPPSWEELARLLPTEQQQELLALAARQGVVFAHQLPAVDAALVQQRRQLLTQLVAGKAGCLPPLAFTPLDVFDAELDAAQREAVARAVATPELCLIQGLPGSGKSRVVAEIVRQVVARGERVLFVSATVTALDRVLEQLGPLDGLFALRGVHTSEARESLPACVRPLTLTERTRSLCETAVQQAQSAARQAEEQLQRRQHELKVWEEIAELTETHEQTREKLLGVQARAAGLTAEVRAAWDSAAPEAGAFAAKVLEAQRQHGERRDTRNAERQKLLDEQGGPLKTETATVANQLAAVRPLVEAWRGGQWWSLAWWKVLFNKAVLQQFADLDRRSGELRQRGEQIAARLQQLDQDEKAGASAHEQRRQQLLDEETSRRQAEVDHEAALLGAEAELLRQRWEQLAASLGTGRPTEASLLAVVPARHQAQALLERDRQQADFTKRWADGLSEAAPVLAARLPTSANLVAATPAALGAEIAFAGLTFDLLVVDEADLIADPDLLLTARRARRWVLLGEPEPSRPRQGAGRSPRTTTTVLPGAFHRLWHQLHVAPRQLPFRWTRNADRLCCRLRPVPDDQRHWVESEPVADRPEIELFILSVPRQEPVLVEVRFPAATPVRQAKEFILRELQEAAAHAVGPAYLWSVADDLVCVQTGTYPPGAWDGPGIERVPLDEGVQEVIRSAAGADEAVLETLGFTFDRPAWDRPRAEVWLAAHLGLKDSGRTAYLGRLHRPSRELGAFLADALFRDAIACTPLAGQNQRTPLPEVIPVPPLGRRDGRRPPDNVRRGGAGLEIDLAANPTADRLAPELRSALPRHGLVNHTEAVALVQSLEGLLSDPAFRKEAHDWQTGRLPAGCSTQVGPAQHCLNGNSRSGLPHAPAVAVSALYEAQVQLLRLLVSRSGVLANLGLVHVGDGRFRLGEELELIVETPPVLRQRECHVLLLSLTRSHATRAVALGEHPVWLPLALTRAARRLLLFADVGTLQRRSQWTSAVDHLDETAAGRERELVVQLLRGQPELEVQPAAPPPLARPVRR